MLNQINRAKILKKTRVYYEDEDLDANKTLEEIMDMFKNDPDHELLKEYLRTSFEKISGTPDYWNRLKKCLRSAFSQKGNPTLFGTFSYADTFEKVFTKTHKNDQKFKICLNFMILEENLHTTRTPLTGSLEMEKNSPYTPSFMR